MQNFKPKPSELWLAHALETVFFGAIVDGGIAVYQAMNSGNFSWGTLVQIFIPVVVAVLAKGWHGNIMANPMFNQALLDGYSDLRNMMLGLLNKQVVTPQPQGPLVVVHAAPQQVQAEVQPAPQRLAAIPQRPSPPVPSPQPVQPNVAAMDTAKIQQVPQQQADFQRSWGDSGVVQVVQPGK